MLFAYMLYLQRADVWRRGHFSDILRNVLEGHGVGIMPRDFTERKLGKYEPFALVAGSTEDVWHLQVPISNNKDLCRKMAEASGLKYLFSSSKMIIQANCPNIWNTKNYTSEPQKAASSKTLETH
jgi:hypothetical protein